MAFNPTKTLEDGDNLANGVLVDDWTVAQPTSEQDPPHTQNHDTNNEFQYEALPSGNHFRLLRLLAGTAYQVVSCYLQCFEIGSPECPSYTAISYTTGTSEGQRRISLRNGVSIDAEGSTTKNFNVFSNLLAALTALRDSRHDRWLWCDAICINQKLIAERNHQVRLMGDIYSNANWVVAWLESGEESSQQLKAVENAFIFIQKAISYNSSSSSVRAYCEFHIMSAWPPDCPINGGQSWKDQWNSLQELCTLRYWTRKWIIQEVISAISVVLQVGRQKYPMADVENFFGQLDCDPLSLLNIKQRGMLARFPLIKRKLSGLYRSRSSPAALLALHRLGKRAGKDYPQNLHELLQRYKDNNCQEACDHVYALYNLIAEHRKHLRVDYALSTAARCERVLRFMQVYEHMPASKLVYITSLLKTLLGLERNADAAKTMVVQDDIGGASFTATAFDLGTAVCVGESRSTISIRSQCPALDIMPPWSLSRSESQWVVQPTSDTRPPDAAAIVSPEDLVCFEIPELGLLGLSSTSIHNGDHIYQFQDTKFALVVRVSNGGRRQMMGRASLFNPANRDRSSNKPMVWTFTEDDGASASVELERYELLLSFADLLELATYAWQAIWSLK